MADDLLAPDDEQPSEEDVEHPDRDEDDAPGIQGPEHLGLTPPG
ncbi:MAG TPA: hypothetical protein VNT23_03710 [Gaiellaceae bacterium]|nr:hypothetical protein [Gaiellaceae bacterium]